MDRGLMSFEQLEMFWHTQENIRNTRLRFLFLNFPKPSFTKGGGGGGGGEEGRFSTPQRFFFNNFWTKHKLETPKFT